MKSDERDDGKGGGSPVERAASARDDVRTATPDEVDWLIGLAAAEGWNPGLDDARAFRAADPDGFLVARERGRVVAGVSVVRQDERSGFLGLYLCTPEARGRGHGRRVWRAGLERLAGHRIGLDGVPAQQENYARAGFRTAWRNRRFTGPVAELDGATGDGHAAPLESGARPVRPTDVAALVALDAAVGGLSRTAFLEAWLAPSPTRRSLWYADAGGRPRAFGTLRSCREHAKVGPLIADSSDLARRLLIELVRASAASTVILDVPDGNPEAMALATGLGLEPGFETARMYRGDPPVVDADRLFGVATLELG